MTVSDAQEVLLQWFLDHTSFDPEEDFGNIFKEKPSDLTKAIFVAALTNLAKAEVLIEVKVGDIEAPVWVLTKPLHMHSQQVELSYPLAKGIANTINDFNKATGGDGRVVESHSVGAQHVAGLIQIIDSLTQTLSDGSKARR